MNWNRIGGYPKEYEHVYVMFRDADKHIQLAYLANGDFWSIGYVKRLADVVAWSYLEPRLSAKEFKDRQQSGTVTLQWHAKEDYPLPKKTPGKAIDLLLAENYGTVGSYELDFVVHWISDDSWTHWAYVPSHPCRKD